ncbi:hypothetical protein FACS1894208_06350 [Clostridia bacterium]|nr:hypothetical protein FACS1894208_06350 [Clostridia bacterium]
MYIEEIEKMAKDYANNRNDYNTTIRGTLHVLLDDNGVFSSAEFTALTGLDKSTFKKISSTKNVRFKLWVLVTICFALKLGLEKSMKIIRLGGYSLEENCLSNEVYRFILEEYSHWTLSEVNIFIDSINEEIGIEDDHIHLLSSDSYDGRGSYLRKNGFSEKPAESQKCVTI